MIYSLKIRVNFIYYISLDLLRGLRILGKFIWMTKQYDM